VTNTFVIDDILLIRCNTQPDSSQWRFRDLPPCDRHTDTTVPYRRRGLRLLAIAVFFEKDSTNNIVSDFLRFNFFKWTNLRLSVNVQKPKVFQLQRASPPDPLTRGSAPRPHWTFYYTSLTLVFLGGGLQLSNAGTECKTSDIGSWGQIFVRLIEGYVANGLNDDHSSILHSYNHKDRRTDGRTDRPI